MSDHIAEVSKKGDLISRQALLRQIDIDSDGEPGYYGDTWKFFDTIKMMPSAQSEIIRCRECREFRRWIGTDTTFCDRTECETKEDDFCSRAERKDE